MVDQPGPFVERLAVSWGALSLPVVEVGVVGVPAVPLVVVFVVALPVILVVTLSVPLGGGAVAGSAAPSDHM